MRLNTANRAFVGIVAAAGAVAAVLVGSACWVFSMLAYRLATGGAHTVGQAGSVAGLVLVGLIAAASWLAATSVRTQATNTARLRRWVSAHQAPVPAGLDTAAAEAGLAGRVDLVDTPGSFSFTHGIARPRVVVSRGLVDSASPEELAAVLVHEAYHVANYDPLKVVLARSLPRALFFLPSLVELRGRYVAGRELAADRRAMGQAGVDSLAGALYKVIGAPPGLELGAAAAIGGEEALDARVDQLESGTEPDPGHLSGRGLALSVGGAGVLATSAAVSFASFAPLMARLCTGG